MKESETPVKAEYKHSIARHYRKHPMQPKISWYARFIHKLKNILKEPIIAPK